MAYKNYKIRDNWLDIDKYNDVDIQSVDGVIQTVKVNGEDVGGGSSWRTVFEGSVTTETLFDIARAIIQDYELNADTIKVTFDGAEYECEKNADGSYGAVMGEISYDWSEYPFSLINTEGGLEFTTESAGTYTLKIEEQSGGGSSDFSTAEVTVTPVDGYVELNGFVPVILDDEGEFLTCVDYLENGYNVVLFNGSFILVTTVEPTYTVSGDASLETISPIMPTDPTRYKLTITGDCTITIS